MANGPRDSGHELSWGSDTRARRTLKLLFPLAVTVIFAVALIVLVKVDKAKGVLTPSQKNIYNVLSIGCIIFLSASLLESLKEVARCARNFINRWCQPTEAAQSQIRDFDSLLSVLRLACSASTQWLRLICILWTAMIAPTIYGVICTLEDGRDYNGTYTRSGSAIVSNVSCYFIGHHCTTDKVAVDQLAHAYGEITVGSKSADPDKCGKFSDTQSMIDAKKDYRYYCRRSTTTQEFGIRFNEYNVNDIRRSYPHFTNRTITASSGPCNEYPLLGNPTEGHVGDPHGDDPTNFISAFNHIYSIDSTSNGSIIIPTSALGREGTTYIYRGPHSPKDAVNRDPNQPKDALTYGYGPRGLWMWVYRNPGQGREPLFYECPVTVGLVNNVKDSSHNISDDVAREAVASIALQGQFKGRISDPNKSWQQWQWYAEKHFWNIENGSTNSDVGAHIAEHAIVSLAEMLANNPRIFVTGNVPYLGSRLRVDSRSFAALTASIIAFGGVATMLGLIAIWKESGGCRELGEDNKLKAMNRGPESTARAGLKGSYAV